MVDPLISCIIPVYNGERYLREAVDSILGQTYRPLQVILADDGSTDKTPDIAAAYGDRVTYIQQTNQGYAAAKNLGLSVAQGDFIAFLDADDVWNPEKLRRQISVMKARPAMDLCFTHYENFWMPELADEQHRYQGNAMAQTQSAWSISTLVARRAAFDRFGNFHDGIRWIENMTWFLRACGQGAVIEVLPEILMYRRFNPESFTRDRARLINNFFPILKEWRDHQRKQGKS
jgi:glycosyltransferase involved in cell wall biosynthesis